MLKTQFVPVAIDQAYQRRQKDTEGDFYRKIAKDGPRGDGSNGGTTQGLYIAAPDGQFLGFSNHRSPERIMQFIRSSLDRFQPDEFDVIERTKVDKRFNPQLPKGGLAVRVQGRVLSGYEGSDSDSLTRNAKYKKIFQSALSRDNLWLTKEEHQMVASGTVPKIVQNRIARFHLVDSTRGEPPMWRSNEVRSVEMKIKEGVITGSAHLETADGSRGYQCQFYGKIKTANGKVTVWDMVALGQFWGEGRYTRGAPKGKFPLGISFTVADGTDLADPIPPQASRGWIDGYLKEQR